MPKTFLPFHIPWIDGGEIHEVVDSLRSGWLTTGPKVKEFEEQFAEYVGARHAVAVNSGTAALHLALEEWGTRPENMAGVDLLPDRIAEARRLCPEAVNLRCGSATKLEFPDATFDLVLQSTVLTSILDSGMKQSIASEMLRVLKPDGIILWYDYHVNNPWNPDVRGVKKREIHEL